MPSRDLLLSPDHGLFIDGALMPAKALINNRNIRQLDRRAALEAARKTTLRHYYERRASRA